MPNKPSIGELLLSVCLGSTGCFVGCAGSGETPPATLSVEQLMDPETCRQCHSQHYAEWSGSMHAYASQDPLFVALNQRAQDAGNVGSLCATCHAPIAVRSGADNIASPSGMCVRKSTTSTVGIGCEVGR